MNYDTQFLIIQGLAGVLVLGALGAVGWLVQTVRRHRR